MKLLFVTYRWGADLVGGAEIHHQRLVKDLVALGHEVHVWSTTGKDIAPVAHWGVAWRDGYPEGESLEEGVHVRRFPTRRVPRNAIGLGAKYLQRRLEAISPLPEPFPTALLDQLVAGESAFLLDGWHHAEAAGDGNASRWSRERARVALRTPSGSGTLQISGFAPKGQRLWLEAPGISDEQAPISGWFHLSRRLERLSTVQSNCVTIRVEPTFRPWRDHRALGARITQILWQPEGAAAPVPLNLWEDWRALGRRAGEPWWDILWQRAEAVPPRLGRLFDWLRGPRSPALEAALRRPPPGYDAVVACNLPWATVPMVARACPLPLAVMALWHMEDDFYYWPQYIAALRNARIVLANTPFSAERFFAPRGIRAAFVGPGVPPVEEPAAGFESRTWRKRFGVGKGEAIVLTVCRKSPEKRYNLVAEAVGLLRAEGRAVRFVLVGPDHDGRPLPDHAIHAGALMKSDLDGAYRACDVLVLMSESESFGMVLAEAWLRGKPVIANAACGPAASLVDSGNDGLLARDAPSLARAIASLLDGPESAREMGARGREKAAREFTQRAATLRFLAAIGSIR